MTKNCGCFWAVPVGFFWGHIKNSFWLELAFRSFWRPDTASVGVDFHSACCLSYISLEKSKIAGPVWCLFLHCAEITSCQLSPVTLVHIKTLSNTQLTQSERKFLLWVSVFLLTLQFWVFLRQNANLASSPQKRMIIYWSQSWMCVNNFSWSGRKVVFGLTTNTYTPPKKKTLTEQIIQSCIHTQGTTFN